MLGDDETYMAAMHKVLKRGDVLRIKGNLPFESDSYHYFVVLNLNPATEEVLILVAGTSQVQKRLEARLRVSSDDGKYVDDTTKVFPKNAYVFLPKQTLFDCNDVYRVRLEVITRKNLLVNNFSLSQDDVQQLIQKVGNSKMVAPYIKHQLGV